MSPQVYCKTEAGRAEIGLRSAGLSPILRQLLIVINGKDNAQTLQAKFKGDLQTLLAQLLALHLIEPAGAPARAPAAPLPAPVPARPFAAPTLAKAPVTLHSVRPIATLPAKALDGNPQQAQAHALLALQRNAIQALRAHFGPDTPLLAQDLLAARSLDEYDQSLKVIEAKLAIYLGRKQAARQVDALRSTE